MSKIILSAVFFFIFTKSIFADHLYDKESYQLGSIEERCIKALEFYLTRPDLETEFHRRLEFCINTVKDLSPKGFTTNPIISDFFSKFGVNGRTRMQVHQGVDIIGLSLIHI